MDGVRSTIDGDEGGRAAATPSSVELAEAGRAVEVLVGSVDSCGVTSSRPELAEVIAGCQGLINVLTAVQDVAIMRVAAIEEEWGEDGLVTESRRAPGHVALDAPDVVAGALCVSHLQAQRRVVLAARLAAAGADAEGAGEDADLDDIEVDDAEVDDAEVDDAEVGDVEVGAAEPEGVDGDGADADDAEDAGPAPSGLGGVHEAMRDGRLDGYAASVIGEELEEAPAQVARAVVRAIEEEFGRECATQLRRRCRRALAKISPDLLRQRAKKAREESGLRRWAEAPGVDRWSGTFPSEQAAMGWAAVDALARRYVKEGVCERLEQARGKALIDLVTGNATIDVTVVITTSEDAVPDSPDAPQDTDPDTPEDAVPDNPDNPDNPDAPRDTDPDASEDADPDSPDSPQDPDGPTDPDSPDAGDDSAADDEDDTEVSGAVTEPSAAFGGRPAPAPAPSRSSSRSAPRRSGVEDLAEAYGPFAGDPMLVRRAWLAGLLRAGARVRFARCHPRTGALLDEDTTSTGSTGSARTSGSSGSSWSTSYRPGKKLQALVRTRDGRCRFPGCSVAARFCDLDHARPWPTGPTTAANLMCLCRRHHRIKQRPGWSVRLAVDGTATWTDPVGRERVSWPRNHLDLLPLPAASPVPAATPARAGPAGASTSARPATDAQGRVAGWPPPAEQVSTLETILEVLGDGYDPGPRPNRFLEPRPMRRDFIRPRAGRRRLRYHAPRACYQHHVTDGTAASGPAPGAWEPPPF